jgi:methylenetetrahydrofolate dehydrogenase (NADP+)/methenyltetrahydrofolate cyclohydrolase/formyltetrahydrofolate synthetase
VNVGAPIASALSNLYANVLSADFSYSEEDLIAACQEADIVVVAAGYPELVKGHWIKPKAVVIDVGINFISHQYADGSETTSTFLKRSSEFQSCVDGDAEERKADLRMVGDVDYQSVSQVASYVTPVPGGVGPLTVAFLLSNTLASAEIKLKSQLTDSK